MEITAGGHRWLVNMRETRSSGPAGRSCWEVSFTQAEQEGGSVEMRWIPCPEQLTERLAHRLFALAGERLWRDRRTGAIYRIQLVDEGGPGDDADLSAGRMMVRFRTGGTAATVPYDLGCPLGLASDAELQALADLALERTRGAPA